jgi:hypothetical protein
MPLPGSAREKQFLSEITEKQQPQFLQEIKEPTHEEPEVLVEETPKKKRKPRKKNS